MPGFRGWTALLTGAALAVPLLASGPAEAAQTADDAAGAYSVTALRFTVDAGGRTCPVDADLYRPDGVDGEHRAPAVVTTNGFGGSKDDDSTAAIARSFASRGYVVLSYSGLGFGASGCPISLDDPRADGRAASGLISFLGGTRAADDGTRIDYVTRDGEDDPRVGMIGGSYGGAIQMATASADHRIDALVPFITWNDLAYSLAPNHTGQRPDSGVSSDVPGVHKFQWTNGFFALGEAQGLLHPNLDPSRLGSGGCLHFVAPACTAKRLLDTGRYPPAQTQRMLDYVREVSPASYLEDVEAPTLLIQGQADTLFNLNEAAATYTTLRDQGTPARMIWQSWGHSGGMDDPAPGELDLGRGNLETSYVGKRILAWFDRYLRGNKAAPTGPAFAYYRDWVDPDDAYATAPDFPAAQGRRMYLSGDGRLVADRDAVRAGTRSYLSTPAATGHSGAALAHFLGVPDPEPYDVPGSHLAWTSAPLPEGLTVAGMPEATLKVDAPSARLTQRSPDAAGKLVLFAKLYDIAPDGTRTLVHRLVAPVRVPDVTKEFTVALPGIVHRYPAGHRLGFVVAAGDTAHYGNSGTGRVSVTSTEGGTGKGGVLKLPVVSGSLPQG
ncbi:CocE/NonD family hydrolase [Streptomyces sp. MTZ3.1]|uniref:CocE/NonD family hydrolase n=1 Tax=Streptomyces meridianus TaxID=2938945 RepID=A0ABT0X878_9ACTN|nr:CocE/NonD family hydrolase [Streptomyces meridianus]MCM2578728.1 CocE/NonD family hydrolase [Streptomyces meridianus]